MLAIDDKVNAKIAVGRFDAFRKNFNRLAKKLVKAGFVPTMTSEYVTEARTEKNSWGEETEVLVSWYAISIDGFPALKKANFEFIGCREDVGGVFINKSIPGFEIDAKCFEGVENECHHCNINRRRNKLYIFQGDGKQIQVGSTCVCEYLGLPCAEELASWYEYELCRSEREDDGMDLDYGCERCVSFESALRMAVIYTDLYGFVGTKTKEGEPVGEGSTKSMILEALYGDSKSRLESYEKRMLAMGRLKARKDAMDTEQVSARVAEIRQWLATQDVSRSEFLRNLQALETANNGSMKFLGYIAALPITYNKAMGQIAERQQNAQNVPSEHQGGVGDKLQVKVLVLKENVCEGFRGPAYLYIMKDENGNMYKWFTSSPALKEGEMVNLLVTVKGHGEYKGVKQTAVFRCKKV